MLPERILTVTNSTSSSQINTAAWRLHTGRSRTTYRTQVYKSFVNEKRACDSDIISRGSIGVETVRGRELPLAHLVIGLHDIGPHDTKAMTAMHASTQIRVVSKSARELSA